MQRNLRSGHRSAHQRCSRRGRCGCSPAGTTAISFDAASPKIRWKGRVLASSRWPSAFRATTRASRLHPTADGTGGQYEAFPRRPCCSGAGRLKEFETESAPFSKGCLAASRAGPRGATPCATRPLKPIGPSGIRVGDLFRSRGAADPAGYRWCSCARKIATAGSGICGLPDQLEVGGGRRRSSG